MKKNISIILFSCILIISLFAVNYTKTNSKINNNAFKNDTKISYDEEFIEGKNIIESAAFSDKIVSDDFNELANYSDSIVKGTVQSVKYEPLEGNAWTRLEFQVEEDYKGDLKSGEIIIIYYMGGYIALEDHIKYYDDAFRFEKISEKAKANTIIKEYVDGENEFVKKGENLIMCLVKAREVFPQNSYERIDTAGMLKPEGNTYKQKYGEAEKKYSININELSKIKKIATK